MALRLTMFARLRRVAWPAAIASLCFGGLWSTPAERPAAPAEQPSAAAEQPAAAEDPLGPNGACYVCHMTFVREELVKTHAAHQVPCTKCHGLSAKHANDENVGASKPDVTYGRADVDSSCRTCHAKHNVAAQKVVARFLDRRLPLKTDPVCTDCHGTHHIDRALTGD